MNTLIEALISVDANFSYLFNCLPPFSSLRLFLVQLSLRLIKRIFAHGQHQNSSTREKCTCNCWLLAAFCLWTLFGSGKGVRRGEGDISFASTISGSLLFTVPTAPSTYSYTRTLLRRSDTILVAYMFQDHPDTFCVSYR